jgi:UDP-N-acetylglucosamine 2-epimerase (non-hydrolysing)
VDCDLVCKIGGRNKFLEAGMMNLGYWRQLAICMKCRIIAVLGTRPEAIKLALVIHALRQRSQEFETAVVHTGQHRAMLDHALQFFKIKPDFDLEVMRPNQTLNSLTGHVLDTVENACHRFEPNMVLIQGDTTTAFASALAAY